MCHFVEHDFVGGTRVAGEDEAFGEGGIETLVVGLGEPDEVGRMVICGDAVEMMTIIGMESTERELG